MEIKFVGWQSFRAQGKKSVVLTRSLSGSEKKRKPPEIVADVVLGQGRLPFGLKTRVKPKNIDKPVFFSGPGEYEATGVEVIGYPFGFWFSLDGVGVLWLTSGSPGPKKLVPVAETDVLLMGISEPNGDWRRRTKETIEMFSPSFLVPFPVFSLSEEELMSGNWAKEFLDLADQEGLAPVNSLKVSSPEDLDEEKKIVFLNPLLK